MPLRRGNWEQFANFVNPVVDEKVEKLEEKPKRGPGRPKKVEEDSPVEVDEGTTADE
jgi:hypothetical protein